MSIYIRTLVNRLYPRGDGRALDAVHSNPNLAPCVFVDFGHDVPLGPVRNLIDITLHPRRADLYCSGFLASSVSPLSLFLSISHVPPALVSLRYTFDIGISKNDC